MTLFSSGAAYVVSVWCIFQLGGLVQLPLFLRLFLTGSFALTTVAPAYERHVNNHILLLAVTALLLVALVRLAQECRAGEIRWTRLFWVGTLAGLGYSFDLATGPLLLLCTLGLVAYRCRRIGSVLAVALAALPWLTLHHVLNYMVGGTFGPAEAVPEYLRWPGSSFGLDNMTGTWHHDGFKDSLSYAVGLLFGERGFLGHNLPLFLALPAFVILSRSRVEELPEVLFATIFCGGTWLAYALASNNYSGSCCSVRWFVPFLAPGYYVLALLVRQDSLCRRVFFVLTGWGTILGVIMWYRGPWNHLMVPFFWSIQIEALASAFIVWYWCHRRQRARRLQEAARFASGPWMGRPALRRGPRASDSSGTHRLTPTP